MNHMVEVAHMLGLELNENFHVKLDPDVTLESDYRFTEKGLMRYHKIYEEWEYAIYDTFLHLLDGKYEVVKLSKCILAEEERNYLSQVIKPFREKVRHISKLSLKNAEYLCIDISFDWEEDSILLPSFATGTLYKGMEIGKEYSVKDLDL